MKFACNFEALLAYPALGFFLIGLAWLIIRKRSWRAVFSFIARGLAALLLLGATFEPRLEHSSQEHSAVIMLDISDSMDEGSAQQLLNQAFELAPGSAYLPFASGAAPFALDGSKEPDYRAIKSNWENLDIGHSNIERVLGQALSIEAKSGSLASAVLISDGYQNHGSALRAAAQLAAAGIKVFPLVPETAAAAQNIFRISNVHAPLIAPAQKSVDIRVSITNTFPTSQSGHLVVRHDDRVIFDRTVDASAVSELLIVAESDPSKEGIKEITASLTPRDESLTSSSFTSFLSGETREKVLLLAGSADDYRLLIDAMRGQAYQVTLRNVAEHGAQGRLQNLPPLTEFSALLLANIGYQQLPPGAAAEIKQYVSSGGGLIMIGGNKSFGLGGYMNTPIADVLPVECLPPRAEEKRLNVAVALVIDKSKSMASDNKLEFAKEAGRAVISNLKDEDYIGVIGFDNSPFEVVQLGQLSKNRDHALERIGRLYPLGGTNPFPAMAEARRRLEGVNAGRKHMILLTDGIIRDAGPEYYEMVKDMRFLGITVSTVMMGIEEDFGFLKNLAQHGGGSYYQTSDASNLPKIFLQDVKVRAGEQTLQEKRDFPVRLGERRPLSTKLEAFPPLRGYVETRPREQALTELLIVDQDKGKPLLASWQFGNGRSAAFTSDANGRWSNYWAAWPKFTQFWTEVLDSIRPERGVESAPIRFDLRHSVENGDVLLDLSVFSDEAQGTPQALAVSPDGKSHEITFRSVSRGRFEAAIPGAMAGKYEVRGRIGERKLTPVAFALSGELFGEKKGQGFNLSVLEQIASVTGGVLNPSKELIAQQSRTVTSSQALDSWFLLAAAVLLIIEIAVRQLFNYRLWWMRSRISLVAYLILFSAVGGCSSKEFLPQETHSDLASLWAAYQHGNRIPNPSFEETDKDNGASDDALAWEGVQCEISREEAVSGSHSLKLRALPGEHASCISDPIPIIPGKYDFSVWLRAADLQLSADRFLNEAVKIRLRLFDSARREISPEVMFLGQIIDSQDLSYSLNRIDNDLTISQLGFSQIHLVPRYYPYDEGWLPDTAAQARVEITLVGPGHIWLDDFDFRLSKYNFPLIERVRLTKNDRMQPALYPSPRSAKRTHPDWQINSSDGIALCFPSNNSPPDWSELSPILGQAISDFEYRLERAVQSELRLHRSCSKNIFTIIIPAPSPSVPGELGHYSIRTFKRAENERGIVLESSDATGQVYGLQLIAQLFSAETAGTIRFSPYDIEDWPASQFRTASGRDSRNRQFRDELMASHWLPELRLNILFIEAQSKTLGWWPIRTESLRAVQMLSSLQDAQPLLSIGILINPYLMRGTSDLGQSFVFSDSQNIERLYSVIRAYLSRSVSHLILHSDDFAPVKDGEKFGYTLSHPGDKARFKNLAGAHAYLINTIAKRVNREFPGTAMYFVPPWYNNLFSDLSKGLGPDYLKELCSAIPVDIPILWTGPTVRSLFIDAVHVARFRQMCADHEIILWDNSLYARRHEQYWGKHPSRLHLASLFEPYDVAHPQGEPLPIYLNAHISELYRIQMAPYAAFVWNPDGYQPESALWNYLRMRFGEETAWQLLSFDQLVWEMRQKRLQEPKHHAHRDSLKLNSLLKELQLKLSQRDGALLDELREIALAEMDFTEIE